MQRRRLHLSAAFVVLLIAHAANAQAPTLGRLDFRLVDRSDNPSFLDYTLASRPAPAREYLLEPYFQRSLAEQSVGEFLIANPERYLGLERYELTPMQSALSGAETVASIGFFLGAVGNAAGVFDEDIAWWLTGAAAAAGAAWGASKYDDPGWRIRYRWLPEERR